MIILFFSHFLFLLGIMAAAYADLGKNAKKILTEGYNGHTAKVNVNHGLPGNCTVTTSAAFDTQTSENALAVDLATKLSSTDKGLTVTDKRGINKEWAGSHSLTAAVSNFCDVKNLNMTADSTGKLNLAYKNNFVNESIDYLQETQTFKPTLCLSKNEMAVGLQTSISIQSGNGPEGTNIAAGYLGKSLQGHAHVDADFTKVGASLWGEKGMFEAAVIGAQVLETGDITFEVGGRVNIDKDLFIGAKIDSKENVGLVAKKSFQNNLALSTSVLSPIKDPSNVQLGAGFDFSHNFEVLNAMTKSSASMNMEENVSLNNSESSPKRMSFASPTKHRKQRVGATSKQLGENCTDEKCKPRRRDWEARGE